MSIKAALLLSLGHHSSVFVMFSSLAILGGKVHQNIGKVGMVAMISYGSYDFWHQYITKHRLNTNKELFHNYFIILAKQV